MDKKLTNSFCFKSKVARTEANHDFLILNCDTIKDC